jgi:hypothetical protein
MLERLNAWDVALAPIGGERILPLKKGNNRGNDQEVARLRCNNGPRNWMDQITILAICLQQGIRAIEVHENSIEVLGTDITLK